MKLRYKYHAIDFDDTIVKGEFPEIGEPLPHALRVIQKIKDYGGEIAIWTCRSGENEENVRNWLNDNLVPYDTLNEPFQFFIDMFVDPGRKLLADVYIDDKGVYALMDGGIDWLKIEEFLFVE